MVKSCPVHRLSVHVSVPRAPCPVPRRIRARARLGARTYTRIRAHEQKFRLPTCIKTFFNSAQRVSPGQSGNWFQGVGACASQVRVPYHCARFGSHTTVPRLRGADTGMGSGLGLGLGRPLGVKEIPVVFTTPVWALCQREITARVRVLEGPPSQGGIKWGLGASSTGASRCRAVGSRVHALRWHHSRGNPSVRGGLRPRRSRSHTDKACSPGHLVPYGSMGRGGPLVGMIKPCQWSAPQDVP